MIFVKLHKKIIASLLSGILMPIFLLGASFFPNSLDREADEVNIIFASQTKIVPEKYQLSELKFLFGNDDLPFTYSAKTSQSQLAKMKRDSNLLYAEADSLVQASQLTFTPIVTTNDPYFTTNETDEDKQWYLPKIKLPEAWAFTKGSAAVKVAIIDTGIHASHLDLNDGRIVEGFDVVAGKAIPAGSNSDDNGHGTAVAGVIGAIPNNSKGITGINWDVRMMPVKALEGNGSGSISAVSTAIVWAAENGADIINLSLGGPGFGDDQTLNNAIIYAYNKGSLIIAAAGNDLSDTGISLDSNPVYPICADGGRNMVIGVAATDINDKKASFSNYGVNCVDISAPGKKILTTAYFPSDPSDNILIYGSGTSLAVPIVSGVAALLKANNPSLNNDGMKNILLKTADNIDSLNQSSCLGLSCNGFLGKGRLNALSALAPQPLLDGYLVKQAGTEIIYMISGGKKRLVTPFVFNQRGFLASEVINELNNQLNNYPTGIPLGPNEGTLVKSPENPTVYFIHNDQKLPLFHLVFQSRNFRFSDVQTMPYSELLQIPTGEWYWPPDGVLVLIKGIPTVYVMDNGVKRPVTYFVFTQRKLSFANVVSLTPDEFGHLPQAPDKYWLAPLDGTLVKSDLSPVVYLIQEGAMHAISFEAFMSRKFKFSDVKTLPQAELDVIVPGAPITN
jgi:hypothetical protein